MQKIITVTSRELLMKIARKMLFVFTCVTAALSVLTAAYVAHQPGVDAQALRSLQSALQMQQFHALALLWLTWPRATFVFSRLHALAAVLWVLGVVCFSFNIELNHLVGVQGLRVVTPWGGMAFVLGWLVLAASVWGRQSPDAVTQ